MKQYILILCVMTASWVMGCATGSTQKPVQITKLPESTENQSYVPWRQRQGPAYDGDFWRSFGRDGKEFAPRLWDDTTALVKNPVSLICLGAAGAAGIALNGPNADDRVQRHYEKHGSQLNTFWDTVGDAGGNPGAHFAIAGAMYFASLAGEEPETYENSKTLLRALALNGIFTTMLKAAAHTESPNGNESGWPSGHTSSSFTLATVLWNEYGPLVGVPLMGFAGYVGYERIDARNHDFSDVISGALIGTAIGYAVCKNEEIRIGEFTVVPFVDPQSGGAGLALAKRW
ncbi:MAG: phosphatase PAP2 family protein [Sedimentisphaerales bacterium]|nr:phosphatase PAP2 family protein [Sedimentisphaerales bacterium]